MFRVAIHLQLAQTDPVTLIDLPRVDAAEMQVLSEGEIAALLAGYDELAAEADEHERPWWLLAKRLTAVALGTALRRGELLALRSRDVKLLEGLLAVREASSAAAFRRRRAARPGGRSNSGRGRSRFCKSTGRQAPTREPTSSCSRTPSAEHRSTRASCPATTCARR